MIERLQREMKKPLSLLFKLLCYLSAAATVLALAAIVGYILINGIPHLSWEIVFGRYSSENPSMLVPMCTTVVLVICTLILAVPLSVFSAIYLTEYTRRSSRIVGLIRLAIETLGGIPSIVYGLFGSIFFGTVLNWGYSILSGVCTAAIMVLPVIIRATEESIKAVPDTYREASYGLGASKLRTIFKIVLPAASSGIASAIVLSIGRIIGETAALMFTLGTVTNTPRSLMDASRSLALHMYVLTSDGGITGRNTAFATGVVLILVVIVVNLLADRLAEKMGGKNNLAE